MKRIKFIRTDFGICICLDDSLFKNEQEKANKTIETLKLFSGKIVKYEGFIFVNDHDKLIIEDLNNLKCAYELICTNKIFFSDEKESKMKIIFDNKQIFDFLNFLFKHDLTFEGDGFANTDDVLLKYVINDHDGSYITFNSEKFKNEKYEQLLKHIFQ